MMMKRLTIRQQVCAAILLTFFAAAIIFEAISIPFEKKRRELIIQKIEQSLDAIAVQREGELANEMFLRHYGAVNMILTGISQSEGVLAVHAYDTDGRMVSTTGAGFAAGVYFGGGDIPGGKYLFEETVRNRQPVLLYARPIDIIGERFGYMEIVYSLENINDFFRTTAALGISLLLGTLLLLFVLLNSLLWYFVLKPANMLKETMKKVNEGLLGEQIDVGTDNEIGEMASVFNRMSADNAAMYRELDALSKNLEKKVRERTSELTRAQEITLSAVRELEETKGYTENIIASLLDVLVVTDTKGIIQMANHTAFKLLGYDREDALIGRHVSIMLEEGDLFEKVLRKEEIKTLQVYYKARDGRRIPMLFSAALMRSKEGVPLRIVSIAKDVTLQMKIEGEHEKLIDELKGRQALLERQKEETEKSRRAIKNVASDLKRSNMILENQKAELVKINKELDDFTYIVSHDLKEPLRSIDAFSKFIADDHGSSLDEQERYYLDRIRANAVRMQQLIEDLLEISRVSRKQNPFEEIDSVLLVKEAMSRMEYAINQENVKVNIKGPLPKIFCDRVRITEVFVNLLSNAVKFRDKPELIIEIGCRRTGQVYEFYVKDNGPGIEKQYHEKIFGIFQRLGRKEDFEGTGAGLTIVKKIIEMHSGRVRVESAPGEGTAFYFTVPLHAVPEGEVHSDYGVADQEHVYR